MQDNSRRWILREHTAAAHAAVDEAIGGFSDTDSYKRYLVSVAAFRRPIERMLDAAHWPDAFGEWRPRTLGAALAADLEDLGLTASEGVAASPLPLTGGRLFGTLYVLEGSPLGARLLFQRAQAIGLSATYGARHLALQSGSIESWRHFLARMREEVPFDLEGALEGSLSAFAHARHAFAGAA